MKLFAEIFPVVLGSLCAPEDILSITCNDPKHQGSDSYIYRKSKSEEAAHPIHLSRRLMNLRVREEQAENCLPKQIESTNGKDSKWLVERGRATNN